MNNDKKAFLHDRLEENKKRQEQYRLNSAKFRLMDNIPGFSDKYRFANDNEIKRIEEFIGKLNFSSPGHLRITTKTNTVHENMFMCFLFGTEEYLKIYVYGNYNDFMLDIDEWYCFSPFLLIDEDYIGYIYVNDQGSIVELKI